MFNPPPDPGVGFPFPPPPLSILSSAFSVSAFLLSASLASGLINLIDCPFKNLLNTLSFSTLTATLPLRAEGSGGRGEG